MVGRQLGWVDGWDDKMVQGNRVIVYGRSKHWDHPTEFISRMIDHASHPMKLDQSQSHPSKPIQLNSDRQTSVWKLVTKYYIALLDIHYFSHQFPDPSDQVNHAQAIVILWPSESKDSLSSILDRFPSSRTQSRLVIFDLEPQKLDEDDGWNQICLEHDFECHSSFELREASMSWQCCPWPKIERLSPGNSLSTTQLSPKIAHDQASTSTLLLSHPPSDPPTPHHDQDAVRDDLSLSHFIGSKDSHAGVQDFLIKKNRQTGSAHIEEPTGFDDDFSPFVSAETSELEWEESGRVDDVEDEQLASLEVEEMAHRLFSSGRRSDSSPSFEGLGDLESLVHHLEQLKLEAAGMDDRSRKRLAALVAMAVEDQLGQPE